MVSAPCFSDFLPVSMSLPQYCLDLKISAFHEGFLKDAACTQYKFWFISYNCYYQNCQVPLKHFFSLVTELLVYSISNLTGYGA